MLKTFRVFARAVNPIGHTIGIAQNVKFPFSDFVAVCHGLSPEKTLMLALKSGSTLK